ncbi:hypothetical protein CP967_22740 [Streptomyces nitrosporeus]|uniref:Lipoprotein n=1 Tax=Streptomyces nitrosporeus TaxID=28894 RepID=A0A5J6FLA1_9ACTN|nr:hypothetical protein [Streptomyces nitrosporeus]QEU76701.1 hypothetical protein CP967_22740 [Streptomyces nitrosporeus]
MRVRQAVLPVLALLVLTTAGCSSSGDEDGDGDDQRLTGLRETYCRELGMWQRVRNSADTVTPDPSAYDEAGDVAQDVLRAMRPLREESVHGGATTLGEATARTVGNSDGEAEGSVVRYCADAGFETLTR